MKRMFTGVLIGFLTLGGFDSGVAAKSTTVWLHIISQASKPPMASASIQTG